MGLGLAALWFFTSFTCFTRCWLSSAASASSSCMLPRSSIVCWNWVLSHVGGHQVLLEVLGVVELRQGGAGVQQGGVGLRAPLLTIQLGTFGSGQFRLRARDLDRHMIGLGPIGLNGINGWFGLITVIRISTTCTTYLRNLFGGTASFRHFPPNSPINSCRKTKRNTSAGLIHIYFIYHKDNLNPISLKKKDF